MSLSPAISAGLLLLLLLLLGVIAALLMLLVLVLVLLFGTSVALVAAPLVLTAGPLGEQ